jgi:RNA polymerase sigma-70 factor, ECF subfamily
MALAAAGDARAFGELTTRHWKYLYGVCRRITADDGAAEDALQDALLRAWTRAGAFQGKSTPLTWLRAISTNAAIDEVRARSRRPTYADEAIEERAAPDDVALQVTVRVSVDQALARLRPEHRAALVLWLHYRLSYQEVADELGVPLGAAKTWIWRAIRALRKILGQ